MLTGKGFFIWQVANCEGGDAARIAQAAREAGMAWVAVKVADGPVPFNRDPHDAARSLLPPLAEALREVGVAVWGWQYVYGQRPASEADAARAQIDALGLDGFIVDAEAEFKLPGMAAAAGKYLERLRADGPRLPLGLCSYRFPRLHPEFPWDAFLAGVDYNLPQLYWEDAHNPAVQLLRSAVEFDARKVRRPLVPVAPAYRRGNWAPTAADLGAFHDAVADLKLAGEGYFSWDECRRDLPALWAVINPVQEEKTYLPLVAN